MDMPGFGSSTWSASQACKVQDFASDVLAVADRQGWDRFVLAGHSMGGRNIPGDNPVGLIAALRPFLAN